MERLIHAAFCRRDDANAPGAWNRYVHGLRRGVAVLTFIMLAACGPAPKDLTELAIRDSVYVDPGSLEPYSGPVFRGFPDGPEGVQLEGHLLRGAWDGEIMVYHPNGRIRYMGSFRNGERCGPWTENADSVPLGDLYDAVVREVETLGLYPPCDNESND